MIETNNINDLIGADVYGPDNTKIGSVGQVYIDAENHTPTWVTIKTGLLGTSESFAPLTNASFDGDTVRIGYDKHFVKDAPRVADDGSLSEEEEHSLHGYYGHTTGSGTTSESSDTGVYDRDADHAETREGRRAEHSTEGYDTSGPNTDEAMTRSEERLNVNTEQVEAGRARLEKHIVTENVATTIPVSHEEVTLQREPITDANRAEATAGTELISEEHETVLTEERVVIAKEPVPVERVSLDTETITEQYEVNAEVAHEEIKLVDPRTNTTPDPAPTIDPHGDANTNR